MKKILIASLTVLSMAISAAAYGALQDKPLSGESYAAESTSSEKAEKEYNVLIGLDKRELNTDGLPMKAYSEDGVVMVPLRRVSEALGYVVDWNPENGEITVDDDYIQSAVLRHNSKNVIFSGKLKVIDMSRETENIRETVIINGCTYVPAAFFREFLNDVTVTGNTVIITPSMAELVG